MKFDYDIICIGMGPAGMAVTAMGSEMGLKIMGVEKRKVGGECLNCGCIPSKALLRMGQMRHNTLITEKFALSKIDQPSVTGTFEKIKKDLKFINDKKTMKMFEKVDLKLSSAKFVGKRTVEIDGKQYTARKIFIAAGTKPAILPIPGIENAKNLLTNENMFELDEVPKTLAVLGGGAIAVEMAQAFSRLGSKVTVIQRSKNILSKQDSAGAEIVEKAMREEGIDLRPGTLTDKIEQKGNKNIVHLNDGTTIEVDSILAATGREMNFDSLDLEKAGVEYSCSGIKIDKYLRTTNKNIYAVGDCNGKYLFSHAAMHQGMVALMNCMMPIKIKFAKFVVPATIFTEPQLSTVGMTENELKEKGTKYEAYQANYADYGASIAEEIPEGFVKAFVSPFGKIYGAVIVGEGSGEMINEWALATQKKMRLTDIMFLQHSFPTMGFLSKRVSEIWMMDKMKSQKLKTMCTKMFHIFS
jgi:pyruvate/2-oxoglutarate dehydrogenase complex dihydrolipoamide dehydrogenase (E3) component